MPVYVCGLNFRSASLDLLERLAVGPEQRPKALAHLLGQEHVHEAVILSTCNRIEVYAAISRFHGGAGDVRRFLGDFHHLEPEAFTDHLYAYYEERAVQHLFSVAAGIDSMVVGEAQILGQVREAFQAAQAERAAGPQLSALFAHAIRAGRRARNETGIGGGLASTVTAGIRVVEAQLGGLAGRRALLVGAGAMARVAGRALRQAGVGELVVANRTPANGAALARSLDGRAVALARAGAELAAADLAVACTAATSPTLTVETVAKAAARRGPGRPLVVLDLGVPRDVDPGVRGLPGVFLADLDALRAVLETEDGPGREVERARALVAEEVLGFMSGQREARMVPAIRALRARAEQVRQQELSKAAGRLASLGERERAVVEQVTRGLVNKLLHDPLVRGKALAARPDGDLYVAVLRELYGLDDPDGDAGR